MRRGLAVVAGGAGFLGSYAVERLLDEAYDVIVLDACLSSTGENLAYLERAHHHPDGVTVTVLRHDITQHAEGFLLVRELLENAVQAGVQNILFFHLASPASPRDYWRYPLETLHANTLGTENLLHLARDYHARFIYASTSEVYGNPRVSPQPESYYGNVNTTGPRAIYDESKRLGETLAAHYATHYGVDARIVRIFNTYGPRMRLDDGRMVPEFIQAALRGAALPIYGDGFQTRSLCYVSDLVAGLLRVGLAEKLPLWGAPLPILNLGNPKEAHVTTWAKCVWYLCGGVYEQAPLDYLPARSDEPMQRRPDITRARDALDWTPRVHPADGLALTIADIAQRLGLPIPERARQTIAYSAGNNDAIAGFAPLEHDTLDASYIA